MMLILICSRAPTIQRVGQTKECIDETTDDAEAKPEDDDDADYSYKGERSNQWMV